MALLNRYEEFVERVEELGFMAFSDILPGFPSLTAETPGGIWHTGDPDTDPWRWKDKAAGDKRLAFGCILGGSKGFIAPSMYSLFYKVFRPAEHMEERMASGRVSQPVWRLWQLFEERGSLDTGDIRRESGVTKKKGGSRIDTAVRELQQHFYITVGGNRRKLDRFGQPYGWAANVYDRVEDWAPAEWMAANPKIQCDEACEMILDKGVSIGRNIDRRKLSGILGIA